MSSLFRSLWRARSEKETFHHSGPHIPWKGLEEVPLDTSTLDPAAIRQLEQIGAGSGSCRRRSRNGPS